MILGAFLCYDQFSTPIVAIEAGDSRVPSSVITPISVDNNNNNNPTTSEIFDKVMNDSVDDTYEVYPNNTTSNISNASDTIDNSTTSETFDKLLNDSAEDTYEVYPNNTTSNINSGNASVNNESIDYRENNTFENSTFLRWENTKNDSEKVKHYDVENKDNNTVSHEETVVSDKRTRVNSSSFKSIKKEAEPVVVKVSGKINLLELIATKFASLLTWSRYACPLFYYLADHCPLVTYCVFSFVVILITRRLCILVNS